MLIYVSFVETFESINDSVYSEFCKTAGREQQQEVKEIWNTGVSRYLCTGHSFFIFVFSEEAKVCTMLTQIEIH